jgi:multidrug efflux pump subunit AcrA (membrane-fusion protein)
LAIVPIRRLPNELDDAHTSPESQPVIGGIVFETFQQRWDESIEESRIQRLMPHVANAIGNSLAHQRIFLYPLWRYLGRLRFLKQPKYFNKVLVGVSLVIALFLALLFWPVRFYVSADGILIPSRCKPVFSSMEGEIDEVFVKHGDRVQKGQKLIQLSSREHEFRVEEMESKLKTARQRLTHIEDQRHNPKRENSLVDIEENIVSLRTQIETLEAQLTILNEISEQLSLYSPIDGQVITWDLQRQLANRVVNSGVRLMEIADNQGEWMIEIDLPIRRQGHIARALAAGDKEALQVTFLSAADPSKKYTGSVVEIASDVSISDDNQQVIKVLVALENSDISIDQVRSSVAAKVYCGQSSLGYLWFHDIWEFIQKQVLFPVL